jgi:hypothetical protein
MSNKCSNCGLANFPSVLECGRCGAELRPAAKKQGRSFATTLARRAGFLATVCLIGLAGFYVSLIGSAKRLTLDQKRSVNNAIDRLKAAGFSNEAFMMERLAAFRQDDNWLNASVAKENAYAATNFPFEIVTLYPDFFTYPADDTERAAILLHEARHLAGKDEHDAYAFVWNNRKQLGWTADAYGDSAVWQNVRRQTRENVPELFTCERNEAADCTQ